MNKPKHTPGKWTVVPSDSLFGQYKIREVYDRHEKLWNETYYTQKTEEGFQAIVGEEDEANARLIAACPRMYEYVEKQAHDDDVEAKQIMQEINAQARKP